MTDPCDYVPTTAKDFVGPASKVAAVLEMRAARLLKSGRGQAKLLFYGQAGTGKTALANMLAARLAGHGTDVETVNGRSVTVDLVRQWQTECRYVPMSGKFRVKVCNELDTCPFAAQDLLLSYLDEMGQQTVFIGTSNLDLGQLAERFQTRLQQFRLDGADAQDIAALLARWNVPRDMAEQIATGCNGNVRAALLDAQTFLDAQAIAA